MTAVWFTFPHQSQALQPPFIKNLQTWSFWLPLIWYKIFILPMAKQNRWEKLLFWQFHCLPTNDHVYYYQSFISYITLLTAVSLSLGHPLMQMHQPYYYHVLYLAHIHNISPL